MNNTFLIPANSKKSMLIFGFFTGKDLVVVGAGVFATIVMLLIVDSQSTMQMIFAIIPACLAGLMVMPVPNYHNVMQLIINFMNFLTNRRRYYWRGWCVKDDIK